jgi:transporter family-2 protein
MRRRRLLAVLLAFGGGLVVATQARINGEFGEVVGSATAAATLSVVSGLIVLTPIVFAITPLRAAVAAVPGAVRSGSLPRWALLAGGLGGFLVFSQTYSVPALGVALYSVLIVAAQTGGGLGVDASGLGPAGKQPITTARVSGAALAVVAVGIAAAPDLSNGALVVSAAVVAVLAGIGAATQSAMLGRLGVATGQPLAAIWVNFAGASLILGAILAVSTATGTDWQLPALGWVWLGGPMGLVVVGTIVIAVPIAGVLIVTLSLVAGQLLGSVALDWFAPVAGREVTIWGLVGALLLMVAVSIASIPGRWALTARTRSAPTATEGAESGTEGVGSGETGSRSTWEDPDP